jgi:hypothetical protein
MKLRCPRCKSDINDEDIELSSETAFCYYCDKDFDCAGWIEAHLADPNYLQHAPQGCSFSQHATGFRVSVPSRSYWWMILLPGAIAISGVACLTVLEAWHRLDPGKTIMELLLLALVLLAVALLVWFKALCSMFGRITVQVEEENGEVFRHVGSLGWRTHFDWALVEKVRVSNYYREDCATSQQIWLDGDRTVLLGRGLKRERLWFLFAALRCMRRRRKASQTPHV